MIPLFSGTFCVPRFLLRLFPWLFALFSDLAPTLFLFLRLVLGTLPRPAFGFFWLLILGTLLPSDFGGGEGLPVSYLVSFPQREGVLCQIRI